MLYVFKCVQLKKYKKEWLINKDIDQNMYKDYPTQICR